MLAMSSLLSPLSSSLSAERYQHVSAQPVPLSGGKIKTVSNGYKDVSKKKKKKRCLSLSVIVSALYFSCLNIKVFTNGLGKLFKCSLNKSIAIFTYKNGHLNTGQCLNQKEIYDFVTCAHIKSPMCFINVSPQICFSDKISPLLKDC